MSKANPLETAVLELILENNTNNILGSNASGLRLAAAGSLTNLYIGLYTADPGETSRQTTNEASYGSYARVALSRADATWTIGTGAANPGQALNAAVISFPTRTNAGSQTVSHWGIGTAQTSTGEMLYSGPLATADTIPFAVNDTGSNAVTNSIIATAHGYAAGSQVVFVTYPGVTLPGNITEGTAYYVTTNDLNPDDFRISATDGGADINITSGSGLVAQIVPQPITQNSTPQISANNLSITED
jgi:hypothetical protein